MQKIRMGVVGLGNMGMNHLRVYLTFPTVDIVSICDINQHRLEQAKRLCRIANTYTHSKEMFEKEKLDGVSIVVPTKFHKEVALAAIAAGVHPLLEKPMAHDTAEAKEIISCLGSKGARCLIGHIERFNPVIDLLKKKLEEGILGKIYTININRIGLLPIPSVENDVIIELAIHDLDILHYLFPQKIKKIHVLSKNKICTPYIDHVSSIMQLEDDTIITLHVNWISSIKKREVTITGEKGVLHLDYITQELRWYKHPRTETIYKNDLFFKRAEGEAILFEIEKKEPLARELEHFLDCITGKAEPIVTARDGLTVLETAEHLCAIAKKEMAYA